MATPYDNQVFWVHWMGRVIREKTIRELAEKIRQKSPNVTAVAIKTNDGHDWQSRYDNDPEMRIDGPAAIFKWARELARNGLQTHLWCVVRGVEPDVEADRVIEACNVPGVRSMILDVESGPAYFGSRPPEVARRLIERVRAGIPSDFHLALNLDARGSHPQNIHIQEWLPHVQSLHPMVYHWHFSESTRGPRTYLDEAFNALRRYNLPIVPMLQAYPDPATGFMVPPEHMTDAGVYSFEKGAAGISYFRLGSYLDDADYAAVAQIDPDSIDVIVEPTPGTQPGETVTEFVVTTIALNVRSKPTTEPRTLLPDYQLRLNDRVQVLPTSRTENEGYVWWRHRYGWSAEKSVDGSEIFMTKIEDGTPPPPPPGDTTTYFVVTAALNVRTQPSLSSSTLIPSEKLGLGEMVDLENNSRRETLGYVWWKHRAGWSAEKRIDGSEVFMVDADSDLQASDFAFQRSPMNLNVMQWFYYYGNTRFAYFYGRQHNYDGYSQGLHGGLDYGHPGNVDVPIFAGVHGIFDYSGSGRAFGPNRVDVLVGDYLIIYGHVARPVQLPRGAAVTPDTVIGFIDRGAQHVHLEIRRAGYIYNPFLFMAPEMRETIFRNFPPTGIFAFYQSSRWNQWLTPLDQPTIRRGGPVIGPRAT